MATFNLFKRFLSGSDRREIRRIQAPTGTRVLVVDDSPTIRAVLAKMLIQDGYVALKAADGETALDVARREQPDLIFLDIVLPRMNGFAVLRAMRRDERTRAIPIVMISGNLQATEQFYVQRFGADDFMKKPFGRAEVFTRIQHLVESGRLPRRADTEVIDVAPTQLADMDHIPDVALPDDALSEDERGPAAAAPDLSAPAEDDEHAHDQHRDAVAPDQLAQAHQPLLEPESVPASDVDAQALDPVAPETSRAAPDPGDTGLRLWDVSAR